MEILGGIAGLILFVLLVVLAIFWLIFPWMVYGQLKSLIQGQKRLEDSQSMMQHIFTKMERHLDGIEISLSSTNPTSSSPQAAYYYSTDGQQQGPLAAADLRSIRKDGLITDETPVLREGESQWRTYRDFLALNR
jgi:hypothetical protein